MFDWVDKILDRLNVLHAAKNENIAAAVGFLFGGIGLGIYFRSFIDVVIPIVTFVVLTYISQTAADIATTYSWLAGAIFASLYGYARVRNSNARLAKALGPAVPANG